MASVSRIFIVKMLAADINMNGKTEVKFFES